MSEKTYIAIARTEDVAPGQSLAVTIAGKSILLCNSNDRIFAVANKCSHAEEPLECGRVRAGWISCPAHGARFDLATGRAINPPAKEPIETFAVRTSGDVIEVEI